MNTKQLLKKGITLSAAAALFTLGACQGKAADVSKEDAYAQLKSALTTTVETNELSVSVRGNFTSWTAAPALPDESITSTATEENKGTIDISLQMKTDEERKITAQSAWIKLLDENEITAQARAYASQLKVNSQNEATERVNSAIARAEEMLSNATRQADDIVKKANAESNETLARAKKWSADIREAASNFADSVLRSADKALVASINEVRDARQKISDTYKGEKNPQ